jgi:hypothetical protein
MGERLDADGRCGHDIGPEVGERSHEVRGLRARAGDHDPPAPEWSPCSRLRRL